MATLQESIMALNEDKELNESWQSLEARMKPIAKEIDKIDDMFGGLRQRITEKSWKKIEQAYDKEMIDKNIRKVSASLSKILKQIK